MTSSATEYFYMLAEDLFRIGNATSPKLGNLRPDDVDRFDRNGIQMVRSNGKGISLLNQKLLNEGYMTGWVWRIPKSISLPSGLAINPDRRRPGHFLLCPSSDMTMAAYCALLSELALRCEKVQKI